MTPGPPRTPRLTLAPGRPSVTPWVLAWLTAYDSIKRFFGVLQPSMQPPCEQLTRRALFSIRRTNYFFELISPRYGPSRDERIDGQHSPIITSVICQSEQRLAVLGFVIQWRVSSQTWPDISRYAHGSKLLSTLGRLLITQKRK